MNADAHRLPLAMKTVFQDLFLLTYAVRPESLAALLPPFVFPHVRDGDAFISIVVGNMRGMRPSIIPEFLGTHYYQIVYRAVVRLRGLDGVERPGVFFLRFDSNDPVMTYFGNRLTEFRFHYFHTGAVGLFERGDEFLITAQTADEAGDLVMHARRRGPADALPPAPGFSSVKEEKEALVELFHAYAFDPGRELLYDLEIERGEWHLVRLELADSFSAFFEGAVHAPGRPSRVAPVHPRVFLRLGADDRDPGFDVAEAVGRRSVGCSVLRGRGGTISNPSYRRRVRSPRSTPNSARGVRGWRSPCSLAHAPYRLLIDPRIAHSGRLSDGRQ